MTVQLVSDQDFWGVRSRLSNLESVQCKGNWAASRHRYVEERYGAAGMKDVAERLESRYREMFESPPLPFVWIPVSIVANIDRAILDGPMRGRIEEMRDFGEFISHHDLNLLYRMFFKVGTPGFLLGRSRIIWGQYFRGGELRPNVSSREGSLVLHDLVLPYYLCEHGVPGWMKAGVEVAGAREVHSTQPRCVHRGDPHCVWHVTWT